MSRVNPLYFLVVAVVVFLFSYQGSHKAEQTLQEALEELNQRKKIALELSALQKAYSPKRKDRLLTFLHSRSLKNDGVVVDVKKTKVVVMAKETTLKTINTLFSKLLNNTYAIEQYSVKKLKGGKYELYLEIVW